MKIDAKEILKQRTRELLDIRKVLGPLDTLIHSNIALLSYIYLKEKHKDIGDSDWRTNHKIGKNQQFDLVGLKNDKCSVVAEVKTTMEKRQPQKKWIQEDIDKLSSIDADYKYFFCVIDWVKEFAECYIKQKGFSKIEVINCLGISWRTTENIDWREYIHSDPEVLLGKPVVKGTRLSVEFILGLFAAGWTEQQVLENYPILTSQNLRAVFAFANDCLREKLLYAVSSKARKRYAHSLREGTLKDQGALESQLTAMAYDPEIQRELKKIDKEFALTELDGLERV